MQAVEALNRLIALGDETLSLNSTLNTEHEELSEQETEIKLATAICQAILNTALPVARFRCHVTVESVVGDSRVGISDFTICSTDIAGIKSGIVGMMREPLEITAHLWEQRQTGADMKSGYQGLTKAPNFRLWYKGLDLYEIMPTIQ